MNKQDKVNVLALLEAYRLKAASDTWSNLPSTDYAIRVCQAIVANVFGYSGRNEWTDDIVAAGLIDYNDHESDPQERYKLLTEIVNKIKI